MAKLPAHIAALGIQEGVDFLSERPEILFASGHAEKLRRRHPHVKGCVLQVVGYLESLEFFL